MPLTVLRSVQSFSPGDLVRLFHQSQLEWSRHLGEETELDFGRGISNPDLPTCADANCLLDAYLVPGVAGDDVIAAMQTRSALVCSVNPSMPIEQTAGLVDALSAAGWVTVTSEILHRKKPVAPKVALQPDLTIIPARASYRHYQQLMEERAAAANGPPVGASMLHLDDSHFDSLLALKDGKPVGCIGVLGGGELGTVREWYVAADHQRQGIGTLLFSRAIEICTRSVFKHVLTGNVTMGEPAQGVCQRFGFESIGRWVVYKKSG